MLDTTAADRQTFRFDARITRDGVEEVLRLILRKNPLAAAILKTSGEVEHDLIETMCTLTKVPVSANHGAETDPVVFGESAMVIKRMLGKSQTSELFNHGPNAPGATR